jgi:hypothetical protein
MTMNAFIRVAIGAEREVLGNFLPAFSGFERHPDQTRDT